MKTVLVPHTSINYSEWNGKTYSSNKSDVRVYLNSKEYHLTKAELETMIASEKKETKTASTKELMQPCPRCGTYCYGDCTAR